MLTKFKNIVKRILGRDSGNKMNTGDDDPIRVEDEHIVIQRDNLEESLPLIQEMAGTEDGLIPQRKITSLTWNGPIMKIQGYFYLEDIPIPDDDLVKKRLLLVNKEGEKIELPLQDIEVDKLDLEDHVPSMYSWAGFKGKFNFSAFTEKSKPLPASEYKTYLTIEARIPGEHRYYKIFPLGNIEHFLDKGFHSAKMEYFSARKEMKFNLLAIYDQQVKTLKLESTKLKEIDPAVMELNNYERRGLFYRFLYTKFFRMMYRFYCLFPLKENMVLFASDSRTDMSGNFQFVYEEMLSRNLDFQYRFMLKSHIKEKKTFKELVTLARYLATSKFIVLDDFYPMVYPLKIRRDAELIQLWHAVGAFKTFGFSRIGLPGGPSPRSKHHRNYTKAIVSSQHIAKYYAEGFGIDEENVVATGIPRTDVFFDEEHQREVRERLYERYPFLRDKKVILFAPTFRGNGQQSAHFPMEALDLERLYHSLQDEYVFIYKIHPFVRNDISIPYQFNDFYHDFSDYREINDLLFIADILITDYSSVCFEFALLNKPMMFFAYDVEHYVQQRDFYFDYHSFIPGPLVKTTGEIIDTIHQGEFKKEKVQPFVDYFFDHTDGRSSERVVDWLFLFPDQEQDEI